MLHRKWLAAEHQLLHSVATFTVPIVVALMLAVWFGFAKAERADLVGSADRRAAAVAIGLVAVVGSIVNDSGINVAMAAFGVAVPAFVWISAQHLLSNLHEVRN